MRFQWFFPLLGLSLSLSAAPAFAWDAHHVLTTHTVFGLKTASPALWRQLNEPVTVVPIESFIANAFGEKCDWGTFKETVLDGVGRNYEVLYTDGVDFALEYEWARGISRQRIFPHSAPGAGPLAVGRTPKAIDVLSTYSDEPDWGMDDDVPRLQHKGLSKDSEGTATRVLRHFWYKGEEEWGVDFGQDQETDARAQLYYELALVAFATGEPYWGYRFLSNALHYIQDMTQPFHTKAMIGGLVNKLSIFRAKLCEWHPGGANCTPDLTIEQQVIKNSWVVGAYHGAYENFARGLASPHSSFASWSYLSDTNQYYEKYQPVENLPWTSGISPLIDFRIVIPAEQAATNAFADDVGDGSFEAFGFKIKYELEATQKAVLESGKDSSEPYRIATLWRNGWGLEQMTRRQEHAVQPLVDKTNQLFIRTGIWGRQFLQKALESLKDEKTLRAIAERRETFRKKCGSPPSA
ncbi:MAG: hypothetical protein HY075_04020 [Deltaproteobacteria bacterium]|nr:hypothetical protein [Deltaproteobacteria bacterium]